MKNCYWLVTDPLGFSHSIEIDGDQVFGAENIAHSHDEGQRKAVIAQVKSALLSGKPDLLPTGYSARFYPRKEASSETLERITKEWEPTLKRLAQI